MDLPHSLAAATGHRLEQHRQPVLIDKGLEFGEVLERIDHPGDQRNTGVDGELATLGLGTHEPDGGGRRPDPGQPCGLDPFGELGILGEKSVAGVDEVRAARLRRPEQAIDIEIALGSRGRSDGKGLIGHEDVRRSPIDLGVHRHGFDAHLATAADDPNGDLTAIRYQ